MAQPLKQVDRKLLRTFEPINELTADKFEEIIDKSSIEEYPAGRTLFRQGERDKRHFFLMQGQIELSEIGKPRTTLIKAKSPETVKAISDKLPRCCTAKAKTPVTAFVVDPDLLDILLCGEHSADAYQVTELSAEDEPNDWMLRFLQSSTFLHLPTENIQRLLISMEEIKGKKGTVIVKQGEDDDYYYIVKRGECAVTRRPTRKAAEVRLAILSNGDGFGEEALITHGKRNATVTMLEDGTLMRLHKDDFIPLLVDPLLDYIDDSTATTLIKGGSHLLDVRNNAEFQRNALPGATNIPLSALRTRVGSLNPERDYIVYCNDGTLSAAAAFLLTQQGLKCKVLQGGLKTSKLATTGQGDKVVNLEPEPKSARQKKTASGSAKRTGKAKSTDTKPSTASAATSGGFKNTVRSVAQKQAVIADEASTKLQEEAEQLRKQAKDLADKTAQAQAAKSEARRELENLKKEEIARKEAELQAARKNAAEQARRAEEAEKSRKQALKQAEKIQKQNQAKKDRELQAARNKAEEEAQRAKAAEEAHQKAQQEAERMQRMQKTHYTAELDAACKRAEKEATRAKQAEEARLQALAEAKRLEESQQRYNNELESARQRVEQEAERARKADESRKLALAEADRLKQEAELTKQQAVEETEKLRADASATRKLAETELARIRAQAEEASERQAELETERQRARDEARKAAEAASSTREKAEQDAQRLRAEAEAIREQAREEAERLRDELTLTRQQMAQEAAKARNEAEAAARIRREAEEAAEAQAAAARAAIARVEAETAAQARAKAEAEATTRARAEAEAAERARAEATERLQRETEANERALEAEREAAEHAQAEREAAERAQAEAEAAARAEAEANARRQAETAARSKAEAEAEARRRAEEAVQAEQEARERLEAERRRQAAREESETKAREMAEEIVTKLHEADRQRKETDTAANSSGMSLARTQVREVKGRTILEGEEDIFIFQRPKAVHEVEDEDDEDIPELSAAADEKRPARSRRKKKQDDDIPSFTVGDSAGSPEIEMVGGGRDDYDFSSLAPMNAVRPGPQENKDRDGKSAFQRHKRSVIAIAASVVMVGVLGFFALTRETYVDIDKVASWVDPQQKSTQQPDEIDSAVAAAAADNDKQLAGMAAARSHANARVRDEAESEYQRLLSKWKQQLITDQPEPAAESDEILPTTEVEETILERP